MITVGIASIPQRVNSLRRTIDSLYSNVDKLFIALNGYLEVPSWASEYPKGEFTIYDNSLGDAAKFARISEVNGYFLGCDDDIVYSPSYPDYMCRKVDQYHCPVSLHGKVYAERPARFRRATKVFQCRADVLIDVKVDVVGTGVLCFHTRDIKVSIGDFKKSNAADLYFSKVAREQSIPLMVASHSNSIIGYMEQPWTIWAHGDKSFQDELLNSFI